MTVTSAKTSTAARRRPLALLGLVAITAFVSLSTGAQAGCKQSFCMSGYDEGRTHYVEFSYSKGGQTHYNLRTPDGTQHELGRNETFFSFRNPKKGSKATYSIQACRRGGVFESSSCTPWVNFSYTVK